MPLLLGYSFGVKFFNFTLRRNDIDSNFDGLPLNPPAPLLQATVSE